MSVWTGPRCNTLHLEMPQKNFILWQKTLVSKIWNPSETWLSTWPVNLFSLESFKPETKKSKTFWQNKLKFRHLLFPPVTWILNHLTYAVTDTLLPCYHIWWRWWHDGLISPHQSPPDWQFWSENAGAHRELEPVWCQVWPAGQGWPVIGLLQAILAFDWLTSG